MIKIKFPLSILAFKAPPQPLLNIAQIALPKESNRLCSVVRLDQEPAKFFPSLKSLRRASVLFCLVCTKTHELLQLSSNCSFDSLRCIPLGIFHGRFGVQTTPPTYCRIVSCRKWWRRKERETLCMKKCKEKPRTRGRWRPGSYMI